MIHQRVCSISKQSVELLFKKWEDCNKQCTLCENGKLDEYHITIECPKLQNRRREIGNNEWAAAVTSSCQTVNEKRANFKNYLANFKDALIIGKKIEMMFMLKLWENEIEKYTYTGTLGEPVPVCRPKQQNL